MKNFTFLKIGFAALIVYLLLFAAGVQSQTTVFNEDFEGTLQVTPTGIPAWSVNTTVQVSGSNSYHAVVDLNSVSYFETNTINLSSYSYVLLDFQHICKVQFGDSARIFVSVDDGFTWQVIPNSAYLGSGVYFINNMEGFSAASYSAAWLPGNAIAVPDNTWWKHEQFDISSLVANQSQVKFRFYLKDGNSDGSMLNAGWFIDDIVIIASPFELVPPTITLNTPIPQDTIFGTGPFLVSAEITDASGISAAYLIYTVNGVTDTITMINTIGNTYQGFIPSMPLNTHVEWYLSAFDNPPALNNAMTPVKWFFTKKQPAEYVIGSGNLVPGNTLYHPIYRFSNNSTTSRSLSVVVYTQSELAAAGILPGTSITKLAWDKSGTGGTNTALDFKVWMRNSTTTPPLLTTTTWQYVLSNFNQVYANANHQVQAIAGWHEITLVTPFIYTGGSIEIASETFFSGTQPWTSDKFDWKYSSGQKLQ